MTEEAIRLGVHYDKVRETIHKNLEDGFVRGKTVGFDCLQRLYSIRLKGTTYIHGPAFSGKSEIWFEFLINLSLQFKWKHVLFSPETGDVEEVYEHLLEMATQKDFYNLSKPELEKAEKWVRRYFYVIDPKDTDPDVFALYKELDNVLEEWGEFHTFTIDPFNELETSYKNEPRDQVLGKILSRIRKESRKRNIHTCVVFHDQDIPMRKWREKVDGDDFWYYPPATMRQISGGQEPARRAEFVICAWRPPHQLKDEHGMNYPPNTLVLLIQKFKPKRYGATGEAVLYFNKEKGRYYENYNGNDSYGWEYTT